MYSMWVTHYNTASSNNENNREISLNRYIKSSILTLGARSALSFVLMREPLLFRILVFSLKTISFPVRWIKFADTRSSEDLTSTHPLLISSSAILTANCYFFKDLCLTLSFFASGCKSFVTAICVIEFTRIQDWRQLHFVFWSSLNMNSAFCFQLLQVDQDLVHLQKIKN